MNSHVQRTIGELGTFSIVVPLVWVAAALIGFVALANWPEMFAAPTTPATTLQASSDSSALPPATEPFEIPHEYAAPSPSHPATWHSSGR
jgi:hypothetical protein